MAAAGRAATAAGTLVRWSATVPGVGGAAAVTVGVAGLAHAIWPVLPMGYAVALVAGVFGLRLDRRL